jgi:hypothetical protein
MYLQNYDRHFRDNIGLKWSNLYVVLKPKL